MSARVEREVLSEAFQRHMQGRRLKSAVFLTFRFDPGFFEQDVLPVFLDTPLSHAVPVRLLQLEDTLRELDDIAVYYDHRGLQAVDHSARLDIRRIPIVMNAFFHPKNVLLLVEEGSAEEGDLREILIAGTLSANLTEAGWWHNVEACHIEEIAAGDTASFRDDLLRLIAGVRRVSHRDQEHAALDRIHAFVRRCSQYQHATAAGRLRTRLYTGPGSVPDFLDETVGRRLGGLNLEVISPYFDETDAAPLRTLIERFQPREVRVFLPRTQAGAATCSSRYHETVSRFQDVEWGRLPAEITRRAATQDAGHRTVHAKVYRFWGYGPVREFLFVGSVNLTTAAHSKGGNFETAFLIETENPRKLDWWLEVDSTTPSEFEPESETRDDTAVSRLQVRYDWNAKLGHTLWEAAEPSPELTVRAQGEPVMRLEDLPPGTWTLLSPEHGAKLEDALRNTSFLTVSAPGEPDAMILVQEEGMAHKPSLLLNLSVEDILRYWSLLTPEQKSAFLEIRIGELSASHLVPAPPVRPRDVASIFSTFAGIFHAFSSLQKAVEQAIEAGRTKEAEYRLFGAKYDSLAHLVRRLSEPEVGGDAVTRYVTALTARQLTRYVRTNYSDFRRTHSAEFKQLTKDISQALKARTEIEIDDGKREFFKWFEMWFLRSVRPMEEAAP